MKNDFVTTTTRREQGAETVRQMFGHRFLDKNMGAAFNQQGAVSVMSDWALTQCYGDVWGRPELDLRARSLVTMGVLIATGHSHELANHVRGGIGNGLTETEMTEVALQSVPYVGLPAAGQALQVILETLHAIDNKSVDSTSKDS